MVVAKVTIIGKRYILADDPFASQMFINWQSQQQTAAMYFDLYGMNQFDTSVAVVDFPIDVRCIGSGTTSLDDDLTRMLSANDAYKAWKKGPGMKISVLFVTYSDGGTELYNVYTSASSTRLLAVPGSLKKGDGTRKQIPSENCAMG